VPFLMVPGSIRRRAAKSHVCFAKIAIQWPRDIGFLTLAMGERINQHLAIFVASEGLGRYLPLPQQDHML
jgi:hypothetical protein